MWSLILNAFNVLPSPALFQEYTSVSATQQKTINYIPKSNPHLQTFKIAQNTSLVEAISPLGYSLKHPVSWQRFTTQASDPDSDIFIVRSFTNSPPEIVLTITTTVRDFLQTPINLPRDVKKFDKVAELYAGILAQTGYKIYDIKEVLINGRRGFRVLTETPDKRGSTTVIVEGEDEKMVVSTSIYPIDSSTISREGLEQLIAEIDSIQNSITIRKR
jgi:hypothetical protein